MPIPSKPGATLWTIHNLLYRTTALFNTHSIDSPGATAEILLAYVLGTSRTDLLVRGDRPVGEDDRRRFGDLVRRRLDREPTAYLVGERGFWSLDLRVTPAVLIPRPETECLVERALAEIPPAAGSEPRRILDLGTGSGAILLALAAERPGHRYFGSDRSLSALALARENGRENRVEGVAFFAGDWFAPLGPTRARFHHILSNPPYIATEKIDRLQPEVARYEPRRALDGGGDGMAAIRRIIAEAPDHLAPEGLLFLEMGHDQRSAVAAWAGGVGRYGEVRFFKDPAGLDRVAVLRRRR